MSEPSLTVDDEKVWDEFGHGSYCALMLLWTSLGHYGGGASDSVLRGGGSWACGSSLMCLWVCSDRSSCSQQSRAIHPQSLDIISLSFCTWQASLRLLLEVFHFIHVVTAPEPFAHGNLDTAGSLFLRNAWLDNGYMFMFCLVAFGRIFSVFYVKESSDPAVDSHLALLGFRFFTSCSVEKRALSMLRLRGLPELLALGIWTLRLRAPCC